MNNEEFSDFFLNLKFKVFLILITGKIIFDFTLSDSF